MALCIVIAVRLRLAEHNQYLHPQFRLPALIEVPLPVDAALAAAPEHWAGAEGWRHSRDRYEQELRETLRRAYREALAAGGWLDADGRS